MKEKILYWTPRIVTILGILFMLMFSFDVFEGNEPMGRKLLGFLMHNIPVLILTAILVVAWIWEFLGGLLLFAAVIAATIFFRSFSGNPWSLVVLAPFAITACLFLVHHFQYGKTKG